MGPVVVCRTTLEPDPGCVFGFGGRSALLAKLAWVTWSGNVYSAGDVLLLESKKLSGEDTGLFLSIAPQQGVPVCVGQITPQGSPFSLLPQPDSSPGDSLPRYVQLDAR